MNGVAPEKSNDIEYIEGYIRKMEEDIEWYDDRIEYIQDDIRSAQTYVGGCLKCRDSFTYCDLCEERNEGIEKDFEALEDEIIGRHIYKQRIGELKLRIYNLKKSQED